MNPEFSIEWIEPERTHGQVRNRRGRIRAADLNETFIAPLDVWSSDDYTAQWRSALARILAGATSSTLVTRLMRGKDGSFGGEQWPIYRIGDTAILRNQLVLAETVPGFDPANPYETVEPRKEDASTSEWEVPLIAIAEFMRDAE